jgi:hypothetical protein
LRVAVALDFPFEAERGDFIGHAVVGTNLTRGIKWQALGMPGTTIPLTN